MATATQTPRPAAARPSGHAVSTRTWSGWIGFSAIIALVVGSISLLEGVIAVVRQTYFVVVGNQVIVFDLRTWGWVMIAWGAVFALAALGLAMRSGWARWFTIVVASVNVVGQLGFLGSTQYPLWTLAAIGLDTVVLYALTVGWSHAD